MFAAGLLATDNVSFAVMDGPDTVGRPAPGVTFQLDPAAVLTYTTPRSVTIFQYQLNFATVLAEQQRQQQQQQQFNFVNRLEVRTAYEVSELTRLNLALRGAYTAQSIYGFGTTDAGRAQDEAGVGVFVAGTTMNLDATEGVNRLLSEDLTFTQQLGANVLIPVNPVTPRPNVFGANNTVGLQDRDGFDTYGVNLGTQLAVIGDIECDNDGQCGVGRICAVATHRCEVDPKNAEGVNAQTRATVNVPQLTNRLVLTERHDFNNGLTSNLEAGVQQLLRLTDGGGQFWQPTGRIGLRYEREEAAVALNLSHGMQLNLDVARIILADIAELTGTIPLDRETRRFVLQLQTSFERGSIIDAAGEVLPGFNLFAADAALNFRPERWLPNYFMTLRYQFRYQINEPGFGPTANGPFIQYETHALRNAVALTVGFEFPERQPL